MMGYAQSPSVFYYSLLPDISIIEIGLPLPARYDSAVVSQFRKVLHVVRRND